MLKCDVCGKEFESEEGLKKHREQNHSLTSHERKEMKRKLVEEIKKGDVEKQKSMGRMRTLAMAVAVIVVLAGVGYVASTVIGSPGGDRTGPSASDHWHADYEVDLCGETMPILPASPGGVHTHGDGVMHIHPHAASELYENANLKLFFKNSEVQLTEESISYSEWGEFANGKECNGTPGTLKLFVNDAEMSPITTYVPKDGDDIKIVFG